MAVDLPDCVIFDGHCVLCARFFRFVLRYDQQRQFAFATAQSPVGQGLYAREGLSPTDLDTLLVVRGGQVFHKLDAVMVVLAAMGWPWRGMAVLRALPRPLKDWLYDRMARNRYRLFGRADQCLVPTPDVVSRFLPQGFE